MARGQSRFVYRVGFWGPSRWSSAVADKLRHGRIKFLYDPNYVAAKKKSLEEKKQELESTTKSWNTKKKKPQSELRIIKEELEASEDVEMIENDLELTNALVSGL